MLKLHRKRARWLKVQPDRECKIYSCLRLTGRENPAASQSPPKALPNISSEAERWDEHADFALLQDAPMVHLSSIFFFFAVDVSGLGLGFGFFFPSQWQNKIVKSRRKCRGSWFYK